MVSIRHPRQRLSYFSLLMALSAFMLCLLILSHRVANQLVFHNSLDHWVQDDIQSTPNLPALASGKSVDNQRGTYGGRGDPVHLGGFTDYDGEGISISVWKQLVSVFGVKSVLDIGCGRGFSTSWFDFHKVKALCVEGSRDAIRQTVLRKKKRQLIQHDYTRGPWWPTATYDAAWAISFVDSVSRQYMHNYMATLKQAALVFITSSQRGGWHHVEVHNSTWWISQFEMHGLQYSETLTKQVREWASKERLSGEIGPNGRPLNAQHIWVSMKVFVNPKVASLPQHQHLFPDDGCIEFRPDAYNKQRKIKRPCQESSLETPLPEFFQPIQLTPEMDEAWMQHVRPHIKSVITPQQSALRPKQPVIKEEEPSGPIGGPPQVSQLLQQIRRNETTSVSVVVWPLVEVGVKTAEHVHVENDGIEQSQHLTMAKGLDDYSDNVVWVGDIGCCEMWEKWCRNFAQKIRQAKKDRLRLNLPLTWPIYIVDFTDGIQLPHCPEVDAEMGDNVHYTTRSLVRRFWNAELEWTESLDPIPLQSEGHDYMHTPLIARTDTVQTIEDHLLQRELDLWTPVETLDRPIDISHYWPVHTNTTHVNHDRGQLRGRVSQVLNDLGQRQNYTTFLGIKGKAINEGRRGVAMDYIEGLLESKIVVVSQRDHWEDHYRLMEALLGGALVMTDRMVGMPEGIINGTSVVEFDSAESLENLIVYYLEHPNHRKDIARQGRRVAMSRHRSFHRMEEIIFGRPLSQCQQEFPHCPYVVSGKESN